MTVHPIFYENYALHNFQVVSKPCLSMIVNAKYEEV